MEKTLWEMTAAELAVIIGLYRSGCSWEEIGMIMGFSLIEIEKIVKEYLEAKGEKYFCPFDKKK